MQWEHDRKPSWIKQMEEMLKSFGHRNWVIVADSAFPMLSSTGITTLVTDADHINVLRSTLECIDAYPHIRPIIYIDSELAHIEEQDAPGITTLRQQFNQLLNGLDVRRQPHSELIQKVSEAAKSFQVLVLKSDITLPYTTVFIELDCGYWDEARESCLRERIGKP